MSAQIQQLMYSNLVHLCLVVCLLCVKHTIWEQLQLEHFLKSKEKIHIFNSTGMRLSIPNFIPRKSLASNVPGSRPRYILHNTVESHLV